MWLHDGRHLGLLVALTLLAWGTSGCASTPAVSPSAAAIRVSTAGPPPGEQPIARLRAVHGDGCGFAGGLGSREGALSRLQTLGAQVGADYIQIVGTTEPHVEGECRRNEYVLEGIAYRAASAGAAPSNQPLTYSAASDTLEKARPEDLRLKWVARVMAVAGGASKQHDKDPMLMLPDAPKATDGFGLGVIGADVIRTTPLAGDTLYLGYGLSAGYALGGTEHCSEPLQCNNDKCVCPGTTSKWTGKGFAYGPTLGLVLKRGSFPFLTFWMPALRAYHFVTFSSPDDAGCAAAHGSCGGVSARNVLVTAMLELDWPFHDLNWNQERLITGGCGLGLGAMALFGELADQENARWMLGLRLGMNVDWLSVR